MVLDIHLQALQLLQHLEHIAVVPEIHFSDSKSLSTPGRNSY